jgi:SAM-dependent methyltransferase
MPSQDELTRAYTNIYCSANQAEEFGDPVRWKKAADPYYRTILKAIVDYKISGLVIDYGAGWGFFSEMLRERGFRCLGIEPSSEMVAYAKVQGFPVVKGGGEALDRMDGHASALIMCAVFEHLVDHNLWLRRINSVLDEGGYFITLNPTSAFYTIAGTLLTLGMRGKRLPEFHGALSPPWHTAIFSQKAMGIMAESAGFSLLEVRPVPQGRIGGFYSLMQLSLELINRMGYAMIGNRWPLMNTHIFVMQKTGDL